MKGLILHCGAVAATRKEVEASKPGKPRGPRHNPFPYGEFLDLIETCLALEGLEIREEAYGLLHGGERMFGVMEVGSAIEGELIDRDAPDYSMLVGVRGSYDRTFPRALALGARVFVCDNLSFSGEIVMRTKQTTNIGERLPLMVSYAISQVIDASKVQERRFEHYKGVLLKDGDGFITDLIRHGGLPPSKALQAIQQWDKPEHEEFAKDGNTAWRMHNAITGVLKPRSEDSPRDGLLSNITRTRVLTQLLDNVTGFITPKKLDKDIEL